jgi:hypothetical protein
MKIIELVKSENARNAYREVTKLFIQTVVGYVAGKAAGSAFDRVTKKPDETSEEDLKLVS